ncbi:MAG: acyltransferase [Bacteroidetes bacterium]|nr:acyltransferase [Bacteroidota bacterium]
MKMLKELIIRKLSSWIRPVMIGGYKNSDGSFRKQVRMGSSTTIIRPEKLDLQDHVFIGQYNFLDASNELHIGEGCQITNYVSILTHSSHISIRLYGRSYVDVPETEKLGYKRGAVTIGDYTFIGPHVVIMPGSRIGKGCIISAFSYVDGDFPDFSVIAGQPAQVIKDTRSMDESFLNDHPELMQNYKEWVNRKSI